VGLSLEKCEDYYMDQQEENNPEEILRNELKKARDIGGLFA
jgi:hypothetical protein